MKPPHVHLFVLHLGRRQSIGPVRLHHMWKTACGSASIGISRNAQGSGIADDTAYLLTTYSEAVHQRAEQQMRDMLEGDGFSFRLMRSS